MKKTIVAANWKMNLLRSEASRLATELVSGADNLNLYHKIDLIIAPSFTLLEAVEKVTANTHVDLCAQNVCWMGSGAYTGEVSPSMLIDAGCRWVIIGHSERRHIFLETDRMINMKVNICLKNGLKVILCVGETKDEKEQGMTLDVINNQLQTAMEEISPEEIDNLVIAYEPVWAIGTGLNAEPEDAEIVHKFIKSTVSSLLHCNNEKIRVMYGGSVNTGNISSLVSQSNIDGVLVGGASLNKGDFLKIIQTSGD